MKALVLNAIGHGFDFENVDIASPIGPEVLIDVQASGLCHTDLLFAAVGADVAQIRVGDDVVGSLAQSCGVLCSMSVRPVVPVQTSGVDSAPTE
jgi:S-(hydroxymethyl)glutathione dehydrogenase / alcohol dehydrogenase